MSNFEGKEDLSQDQIAALQLIEESQILRNDEYVKRVVYANGLVESGNKVDIGNFLAARQATLQLENLKAIDPEAVMAAAAISSVRPDMENKL